LLAEVAPLGIGVTCVEPGPFRTDWAGRSLRQTPSTIADYADSAKARMDGTKAYSGTQIGDPVRAGQAIIAAVEQAIPPRHLVLGKFGYEAVTAKLRERLEAVEAARNVSLGADFPDHE
jgi:NAD(P)-dependent dehydrogenase (short-subunit alcohol dehydrogenase family)